MKKIIDVKNATFSYENTRVFSRVNFTVNEGDFVALVGANGSGKSTLLQLLLGELELEEGSILFDGEDVKRKKDWTSVGYMPQLGEKEITSFPATVREILKASLYPEIGLFGRFTKAHNEKIRSALESTGMEDMENQFIGKLSGGQQQRVMLSRILVHSPKILILDEPMTGIDGENIQILLKLLEKLNKKRGLAIFLVTHDLAKIEPYVTSVLCMEDGSLVSLNKEQIKEELSHRHKHPPMGH